MAWFLNPDNKSFIKDVNSKIYVDKTKLIEYTNEVMNTNQCFICNSRPRRFGKSMTADMLCAYYSKGCDSRELFWPYEICKSSSFETYLNRYDVIHIDMQWCKDQVKDVNDIFSYIQKSCMKELQEAYPNIDYSNIISLSGTLAQINDKTGNQFVIIIDEWDVLIRDNAKNKKLQDEYIDFLRGLFKGSIPSRYVALAYLTGILPIKKTTTQSALNNFDEYTMLNPGPLASYFGFTETEVKKLCEEYQADFEKVKKWYDGYLLGQEHVYNPKAVVNFLNFRVLQSYWTQTSSYESINCLIKMNFDGLKESIIEMLSGNRIEVDTDLFSNDVHFTDKEDVLTYLIHLGYLAFQRTSTQNLAFIPNEEIRYEFNKVLKKDKWNDLIEFEKESSQVLEATLDMDEGGLASSIEKIHNTYASNIYYNNENSLSSVLTIAYLSTMKQYFKPIRELPTGRGFADFVYIPKPEYKEEYPALLVELKWNQNAKTAINQIRNKKYFESLEGYTDDLILVEINYDKKTKEHSVKLEQFNEEKM